MNEAKNPYRLMREIQNTQLEQVNEESICFRKRVASWPIAYEHTNRAQFYQQLGKCTLKTSDVQMDSRHMQIGFHPHCWKSVPLSPSPWTRPWSLTPEKSSVPEQESYHSTALREAYQRSWWEQCCVARDWVDREGVWPGGPGPWRGHGGWPAEKPDRALAPASSHQQGPEACRHEVLR